MWPLGILLILVLLVVKQYVYRKRALKQLAEDFKDFESAYRDGTSRFETQLDQLQIDLNEQKECLDRFVTQVLDRADSIVEVNETMNEENQKALWRVQLIDNILNHSEISSQRPEVKK